jgi:prephenate dehydrogenase
VKKLAICGLGLIGGSIGLAARERRLAREVYGLVRRPCSARMAKRMGVVDLATRDPAEAVRGAEMVVIAVTLGATAAVAERVRPHLPAGCIVTDVGSCKRLVIARTRGALGRGACFVGAHPIAGSERSGMGASRADMFEGAPCILTPVRGTDPAALEKTAAFWEALGARVSVMSPAAHDRVVAAVSHLPHLLAAALVNASVGMRGGQRPVLDYAGSGFRDSTRVAAGDPGIWAEIAADNPREILRAVDRLEKQISLLKRALRRQDRGTVRRFLARAAGARRTLNAG